MEWNGMEWKRMEEERKGKSERKRKSEGERGRAQERANRQSGLSGERWFAFSDRRGTIRAKCRVAWSAPSSGEPLWQRLVQRTVIH